MAIFVLLLGLCWLAVGYFLTRWVLRLYLGSVFEAGKSNQAPFQFSVTDIYALTVQIALFSLPLTQLGIPIDERAGLLVALTLYLALSWVLCCRALSRVKIRKSKPRIAAILVFPFQLASASILGFGWLHWIASVIFAIGIMGAAFLFSLISLLLSGRFSDWLMKYSEMGKGETTGLRTESATQDIISESQVNRAEDKILPPPDAFPRG